MAIWLRVQWGNFDLSHFNRYTVSRYAHNCDFFCIPARVYSLLIKVYGQIESLRNDNLRFCVLDSCALHTQTTNPIMSLTIDQVLVDLP